MKNATCTHAGCTGPYYSNGYCRLHFGRWYHGRPMDAAPSKKFKPPRACSVDGCDDLTYLRDLCTKHYRRWQRHGDVAANYKFLTGVDGVKRTDFCEVDGCEQTVYVRDWCRSHYTRWQRSGDARAEVPLQRRPEGVWTCATEGCTQQIASRTWCKDCQRQRGTDRWRERLRHLRETDPAAYRQHLDRSMERARAWRDKNPEAYKNLELRKRAKRSAAPRIPFTGQQLAARMAYWGNRCWMCSGPFEEVDHVKPIAKGGWHILANLRPACFRCNNQKSDKWPILIAPRSAAGVAA